MAKCKITILKKTLHKELAEEYCQGDVQECNRCTVGEEYIADSIKEPEGFPCSGAWASFSNLLFVLLQGGNFGPSSWNWMKNDDTMITCCSDGVRPVLFKLERICD